MPAVNDVGEPGAREPHARFDGRELETELNLTTATKKNDPAGNRSVTRGFVTYRQAPSPRQFPTLQYLQRRCSRVRLASSGPEHCVAAGRFHG